MFAYFFPPAATGVRRVVSLVEHLPSAGWEPVVVACRATRGAGVDAGPLSNPRVAGARVVRTESLDPYRLVERLRPSNGRVGAGCEGGACGRGVMNWLRRHLFFPDDRAGWIPFAVAAGLREVRAGRVQALYSSNYPQSSHLAAWIVHRLTGLPWLADFRDGWTQNPAFHDPGNAVLAALHRWGERAVARSATRLVTVSPPLTRHLQGLRPGVRVPAETVFNGFEPGEWGRARQQAAALGPLVPGRRTLLYAGTFFGRRRPDLFLSALRRVLRREPAWRDRLRVRFRCALDARSVGLIRRWDLADVVEVLPPLRFAQIVVEQLRADACLLVLERGPGSEIMVSQKVFEYLAAGRPILALVPPGAAAELLAETGGAEVVTDPHPRRAAQALRRLLVGLEEGSAPRPDPARVARFERGAQAARIAGLLDQMVAETR
jgi:glycosyltransferase involved in cell wall biosynthesis